MKYLRALATCALAGCGEIKPQMPAPNSKNPGNPVAKAVDPLPANLQAKAVDPPILPANPQAKMPIAWQLAELEPGGKVNERIFGVLLINQKLEQATVRAEVRRSNGQLGFETQVTVPGNGKFELVGDAKELSVNDNLEALIFPGDTVTISSDFYNDKIVIKVPGTRIELPDASKIIDLKFKNYVKDPMDGGPPIGAVEVTLVNKEKDPVDVTCSVFTSDGKFIFSRDFKLRESGDEAEFRDDGQRVGEVVKAGDLINVSGPKLKTNKIRVPEGPPDAKGFDWRQVFGFRAPEKKPQDDNQPGNGPAGAQNNVKAQEQLKPPDPEPQQEDLDRAKLEKAMREAADRQRTRNEAARAPIGFPDIQKDLPGVHRLPVEVPAAGQGQNGLEERRGGLKQRAQPMPLGQKTSGKGNPGPPQAEQKTGNFEGDLRRELTAGTLHIQEDPAGERFIVNSVTGTKVALADIVQAAPGLADLQKAPIPAKVQEKPRKGAQPRAALPKQLPPIKIEDFDGRKLLGPNGEVPGNDANGNALPNIRPFVPDNLEGLGLGALNLLGNPADYNVVRAEYLKLKNKVRMLQERGFPLAAGMRPDEITRWMELNGPGMRNSDGQSIFEGRR